MCIGNNCYLVDFFGFMFIARVEKSDSFENRFRNYAPFLDEEIDDGFETEEQSIQGLYSAYGGSVENITGMKVQEIYDVLLENLINLQEKDRHEAEAARKAFINFLDYYRDLNVFTA